MQISRYVDHQQFVKKKPQQTLRLFHDRASSTEAQTEKGPYYLAWLRLNMRSIFSLVASQQDCDWLAAFRAWLAVLCAPEAADLASAAAELAEAAASEADLASAATRSRRAESASMLDDEAQPAATTIVMARTLP